MENDNIGSLLSSSGYLVLCDLTLFLHRSIITCSISALREKDLVRLTGLTETEITIVVVVVVN